MIDQRQRPSNAAAAIPFRFLTDEEFSAIDTEPNLIPLLTSESVAKRRQSGQEEGARRW